MELLVATLAHMEANKVEDDPTRLRYISETIRNAPGLVNARFFRSSEQESSYFILTTWEDEDFWLKAQDRYNPKNLFKASIAELLLASPEQWLMRYLWGYSRPSAQPTIAAAQLITVRPEHAERVEQNWIEGLRRLVTQPVLSFAFLARGRNEENAANTLNSSFLSLLSWPGETQRKDFYMDHNYKAISGFLTSVGVMKVFSLEPLEAR